MHTSQSLRKGFSLLEILLVLALLGILFSSFLYALNPRRISTDISDKQRQADALTISQAIQQYSLKNNAYPPSIVSASNGSTTKICKTGSETVGGATNCTGLIDLRTLVPTYLANIPAYSESSTESGFYMIKEGGRPYIGGVNELDNSTFVQGRTNQNFTP